MQQYKKHLVLRPLLLAFCILFLKTNLLGQTVNKVTIKIFIEGFYLPGETQSNFLYVNFLSPFPDHSDSINILLAQTIPPYTVIQSTHAVLQTNGIAIAEFPASVSGQSCYIIVKHRNSVETWSKLPVLISENTYYNFSGIHQFPSVTTATVGAISSNGAVSGGTVVDDGGSPIVTRGVCWDASPNPTVDLPFKTINGFGPGSFISNIFSLQPNTGYYVRAYATNSVGTSYGNNEYFVTSPNPSCAGLSSVTDIDGNSYNLVAIGNQCWTRENLKVSKYRNGNPIPTGLSNASWQSTTSGAFAIYNNSPSNENIYGKLYNWYAVVDSRGLCPSGWHVPSDAEWTTLSDFLGGQAVAGGKMKEVSPLWSTPNVGASNSSGFTALPAGNRDNQGPFGNAGLFGSWWSTTNFSTSDAYYRILYNNYQSIYRFNFYKTNGYSVRCLKNTPPKLTTNAVTVLSSNGAASGGNVTDDGGATVTVRGLVWSTTPNPVVSSSNTTTSGSGLGSFNSYALALSQGTTYYIRAYATNSVGTGYGNEISFTTMDVPKVSTTATTPLPIPLANWSPYMPASFPTNASGQINGISRVSQMKFHPSDAQKMYAVSARGGLFISTNGGDNWSIATGCDNLPNGTRFSSVCIDHTDDRVIYLGGGDRNYYYSGSGMWKSTDGGQTFSSSGLNSKIVVEIIMDPGNRNVIVAATSTGIYKTTDGGSTWTLKSGSISFYDMKAKESTGIRVLYASTYNGELYRSSNYGETWTQITNGIYLPAGYFSGGGSRLAVTPADTNIVYLVINAKGGTLFKSTNGGSSFVAVKDNISPFLNGYSNNSADPGQGDYNTGLGVDRLNANIVYFVAHCVWKSTNGGVTWSQLTNWWEKVHTDMHQIVTSPYNNNQLWNMNDGGVWLSTDGGNNWVPKSNGIYGYEIYHGGTSPTRRDMVSIGTQDNGELYANSSGWYTNRGGDWQSHCVFDYTFYSSLVYYFNPDWGPRPTPKRRYVHGSELTYGLPSYVTDFTDIAYYRGNAQLGFIGDTVVLRTTNLISNNPTWTMIYNTGVQIMAMHVNFANPNHLYVITNDAKIHVTTDALVPIPTFTTYTLPSSSFLSASITSIKSKGGVVYITINSHTYRSVDNGATWSSVEYNLPTTNHTAIIADEYFSDNELVFVASGGTVYYKSVCDTIWTLYSTGLPSRTTIVDMSIYNDSTTNSLLRVFTYGRGVWETPIDNLRTMSAVSGGTVIDDGDAAVTARGVCWSTSPNPTVSLSTKTINGSGTGSFTSNISGLNQGSTYYLRAYATNSVGTGYGEEVTFTPSNTLPFTTCVCTPNTVTDIDGNVYNVVTIGSQCWMKENLKTTRYRNGTVIQGNLSNGAWAMSTSGAESNNNNDSANNNIYGKLYNWLAVADPSGLCPTGWHVPSDAEWTNMENVLGGIAVAGGKLKAVSPLWATQNIGATNSSEFTALPGGYRYDNGNFYAPGQGGVWWTSTQYSSTYSWSRNLSHSFIEVYRSFHSKFYGFSVRCVKD